MNWTLAILLSVVAGVGIGLWVYQKDKKILKKWKALPAILRGLGTFLLLLLLCAPSFTSTSVSEEKPQLALLVDRSTSMQLPFNDTNSFTQQITGAIEQLSQKYDVHLYGIGEGVAKDSVWEHWFHHSDLGGSIQEVLQMSQQDPPDAMLVVSDGIYNLGADPSQIVYQAPYKIYTVAVGDSTTLIDAGVQQVLVNKSVPFNAQFECIIDVFAHKLQGQQMQVAVLHGGQVLHQSNISVNEGRQLSSIPLKLTAKQKGLQKYTVSITPLDKEQNILNNQYDFYVDIIDQEVKVLILAQAPHPDVVTIQKALSHLPQYKIELAKSLTSNNLLQSDIIMAIQPDVTVVNVLKQSDKPVLFILGASTPSNVYAQLELSLANNAKTTVDATPILVPQFQNFQLPEKIASVVGVYPPVQGAMLAHTGNMDVLLQQKLGQVATNQPLWFFKQLNNKKIAVVNGEGIWRWSIYEWKKNKNNEVIHDLIKQTVQYIHTQKDKRPFVLYVDKPKFHVYEKVGLAATYKSDMGELNNHPEVQLNIKPNIATASNLMDRLGNSYKSDLGYLPAGNYHVTATLNNGQQKYSSEVSFEVVDYDMELIRTHANYEVMHQIADNSGGQFFTWAQMEQAIAALMHDDAATTILKQHIQEKVLINYKLFFFLILLLFGSEWFLRKYFNL